MKKLYYVENVIQDDDSHYTAVLQYIPSNISRWVKKEEDFRKYIKVTIDTSSLHIVQEGHYVYLSGDKEFESADHDSRVEQIRKRYNELIEILMSQKIESNATSYSNINILYSYHINVGHGNHSLIVFEADKETHIWMVDCSNYDFLQKKYYCKNIDNCLKHIKQNFHLNSPQIDVVMLTHPHYDHYSGIRYYIQNTFIDKNTLFYINLNYNITSHNFNNLLSKISTLQSRIIEPFVDNSNNNIKILYPELNDFKKHKLSFNNMSSVYNICFNNTSYFIFPGDLEKAGWKIMDVFKHCKDFEDVQLYAISHHGSINGHLKKSNLTQVRILHAITLNAIPILMGRDKAFRGIYSSQVIKHFKGNILYSEKDDRNNPASFLEIGLKTSTKSWYY